MVNTGLYFGFCYLASSQILMMSLNEFWGSVNALQLVAHAPLNNIVLPASCYKLFEDLISIASFDFYEPTENFDFNITATKPYNPKFE